MRRFTDELPDASSLRCACDFARTANVCLVQKKNASAATRTQDQSVKSRVLYLLSYGCIPTKVNRINRIYGPSRELRQCIQRCLLSLERSDGYARASRSEAETVGAEYQIVCLFCLKPRNIFPWQPFYKSFIHSEFFQQRNFEMSLSVILRPAERRLFPGRGATRAVLSIPSPIEIQTLQKISMRCE